MTPTDAAFAAARDTAEAAARREMERAEAWAKHLADASEVVEEGCFVHDHDDDCTCHYYGGAP